jgi:hypothetical protein
MSWLPTEHRIPPARSPLGFGTRFKSAARESHASTLTYLPDWCLEMSLYSAADASIPRKRCSRCSCMSGPEPVGLRYRGA